MKRKILLSIAALTVFVSACDPQAAEGGAAQREPAVVDSIHPIEEEIRRFRESVADEPETLGNAATSREELVQRVMAALEEEDLEALAAATITRAEFAYLYYPWTQFVAPPYELSPALAWYRLESYGGRGLNRALQRFGGRPLGYTSHECETEPLVQGDNRLWHGCVVYVEGDDRQPVPLSLFGVIMERDGRFKLLSYTNEL